MRDPNRPMTIPGELDAPINRQPASKPPAPPPRIWQSVPGHPGYVRNPVTGDVRRNVLEERAPAGERFVDRQIQFL